MPLPIEPLPKVIDPDNPPWGIGIGSLVWLASTIFIILFQVLFLAPYLIGQSKDGKTVTPDLFMSPTAVLLLVVSIVPAHLATLGLVWFVVTGANKRPFKETLGWAWSNTFGFWRSAGLGVLLLIMGGILINLISRYFGSNETDIDRIIKASLPASFVLAFVAAFTAPLTEELVYRGVLYSAFKKRFGTNISVVAVTLLFGLVHVPQYKDNIGVLTVILILSFVLTMLRASTGKILPCIIVHFIFNGLQSIGIVLSPYLDKYFSEPVKQQGLIILKTILLQFIS